MELAFQNQKFFLREVEDSKLRAKLHRNSFWKSIPDDGFETRSLKEACKFALVADLKVKKIFQKTFQIFYKVPKIPVELYGKLDLHQIVGIQWILSRKRSYLAHAPGAGKTAQAILSASVSIGRGQSLFVVPPSLVINWEREILKFTEWLDLFPTIGIVRGSVEKENVAWRADFILCPDSMIAKDWVQEKLTTIPWNFICVDEASRFKEPTAERSLAFYGGSNGKRTFPGIFRDARHVVFLDGSPMPNRPIELWAPTYALDPQSIDCLSFDDFGYRYCGAKPNERGVWEYKYSSNEEELRQKITKSFMHVVTEAELTHPERLRSILYMSHDVRSPHQKTWEEKNLSKVEFSEGACQGDLARFRRELGLRKVPWIVEYVKERLDGGESILLFVWHRDVVEAIHKEIPGSGFLYGGVDKRACEYQYDLFQKGEIKLLILNILTAGRGVNLQRADRIIFGEFSWTDQTNLQAEKRASRRGSERKNIRCEYICCPNSMDEVVLKSCFTKERRVKKIIGG